MSYMEQYNKWLNSPVVDQETKDQLIAIGQDQKELEVRFSSMLDFGTAGLRGIMRGGLNGMNVYTVRYATQGIANLINSLPDSEIPDTKAVTIAYDSRYNSQLYAQEAACVLAANQIPCHIFDDLRPTPELSFALRETGSIAGINITASHNPKEYNGYKVYWADGAQLPPHHAAEILNQMKQIDIFDQVKTMDYQAALDSGLVNVIGDHMDQAYLDQVLNQSVSKDTVAQVADDFKIIFTPFHGAGHKLVPEALKRLGIKRLLTVDSQMKPDGGFPTMKSPNPENKEGFLPAITLAQAEDVDLIIATDPDADRVGIVVRNQDEYVTLSGNQVGVLLLDYLIEAKRELGTLAANSAVVKSIVTTPMANAVCEKNGLTIFETLTGFKFIGEKIKEFEETNEYTFLFGFEESYGYLSGTYCRDKDAVVASMLIAEMACYYKKKNINLYQAMNSLYEKYDYFMEKVLSFTFDGYDGPAKMKALTKGLRDNPPKEIFSLDVVEATDYLDTEKTGMPSSDVLFYHLTQGCSVVVRPSGTEPKIKIYLMARGSDKLCCQDRLDGLAQSTKDILGL